MMTDRQIWFCVCVYVCANASMHVLQIKRERERKRDRLQQIGRLCEMYERTQEYMHAEDKERKQGTSERKFSKRESCHSPLPICLLVLNSRLTIMMR